MKNSRLASWKTALPFLLPSLAGFVVFSIIPMIMQIFVSLTSWDGLSELTLFSDFSGFMDRFYVGIENYIYRELLQNITSKDLADGAWTVLEKLHAVHIPMAIGSSSKNTPLIVEKLGIGKFFDAIVDGNQISHSKPDPEVFLLAAEKLHQKPSDCLVVEDAEAGVKAALNGGFLVAGIGPAKDCPNVNYPLLSLSELLAVEGHPA